MITARCSRLEVLATLEAEAKEAGRMVPVLFAENPQSAGVFWSSGKLTDGRWVQVCCYIGRRFDAPDAGPSVPAHLPYVDLQGSLDF